MHVEFIWFLVFVLKHKSPFPKASCDNIVGISESPNKVTGISKNHLKSKKSLGLKNKKIQTWSKQIWSDLDFWILSIFLIFFWIQAILFWFQKLVLVLFLNSSQLFFSNAVFVCCILVNFWLKNQSSLNHQVVFRIHGGLRKAWKLLKKTRVWESPILWKSQKQ